MPGRLHQRAFTLLDVMITVTILGILAAIVIPVMNDHIDRSNETAAESTAVMVRKALDMYFQGHAKWPPTLDPLEFVGDEEIVVPPGYQLLYTPASGEVELAETDPTLGDDGSIIVMTD